MNSTLFCSTFAFIVYTGLSALLVCGKKIPQFDQSNYTVSLPSNSRKATAIVEVKAKSLSQRELRYTLSSINNQNKLFAINASTGLITTTRDLVSEDVNTYSLHVKVFELPDGFSASVPLEIKVESIKESQFTTLSSPSPVNELQTTTNEPTTSEPTTIEPPQFFANINEDIPIGTAILQVPISENQTDLLYSLDRSDFTIDKTGVIFSNKRLDADANNNYLMAVRATKKGQEKIRVNTAIVHIHMANTNDEPPKFTRDMFTVGIDENIRPNSLVVKMDANDKDGDNILYSFENRMLQWRMFQIGERTGEIRVVDGPFKFEDSEYKLTIYARDDGSCCKQGSQIQHTSTATVVLSVVDVNDHKPVFEECESYFASVEEGSPIGTPVIRVKATDADANQNGDLRYFIAHQPNKRSKKFTIDPISGVIKTNKVFDREVEDGKFEMITVKALDRGFPPNEGICSFSVHIVDINDNSPLFDRLEYHVKAKQDSAIGINVVKISASDEDADMNGEIVYRLIPGNDSTDLDYFQIDPNTGWISVKRLFHKNMYAFKAIAADNGNPRHESVVDVMIEVYNQGNNPPIWGQAAYGPISIKESMEVGKLILSLKAFSGIADNPVIFYKITEGNSDVSTNRNIFFINHRLENGLTVADLHLNYPLDHERTKFYNLVVRATNNGETQLYADVLVHLIIEDVNDEIPQFDAHKRISVREGLPIGTKVTKITATDFDASPPHNKVLFAIESRDENDNYFSIDKETGEIYTKIEFDREIRSFYPLLVRVFDASPSALFDRHSGIQLKPNSVTQFIRIEIEDENDNSPIFEASLYKTEVFENEDLQFSVLTVTATDRDESSVLRYEIARGNFGGAFGIKEFTGEIYVAGPIDYELTKEFKLRVVVSDGRREDYATVFVYVKNINDKPPVFEQTLYETTITEEDNTNLPKKILQVKATDGDKDTQNQILYFLSNNPTNNNFAINSTSGEIYVLRPLDRDPPNGRSEWRFTVFADDENGFGLINFVEAVVHLKDINDNSPFFPNAIQVGKVRENSTSGIFALSVHAIDFDDPQEESNSKLSYYIENNFINDKGEQVFRIDEKTGIVSTAVCCLDRETNPDFKLRVIAMDGGGLKGTGTALIKLIDVNDVPAKFAKLIWDVDVNETFGEALPEKPFLLLSVVDEDLKETNRLSYKIMNDSFGSDKFGLITNPDGTASMIVVKPLDYEDIKQKYGFNISVSVSDEAEAFVDPHHVDYADVKIRLKDINDNMPEFVETNIDIVVSEDAPKNTTLAHVHATDEDCEGMSKITYIIDEETDKKRNFKVDENGTIKLRRKLDSDLQPLHKVKILAVDDGIPAFTATATMTVTVSDDYLPISLVTNKNVAVN